MTRHENSQPSKLCCVVEEFKGNGNGQYTYLEQKHNSKHELILFLSGLKCKTWVPRSPKHFLHQNTTTP